MHTYQEELVNQKLANEISDEEISAYYEKNKELFHTEQDVYKRQPLERALGSYETADALSMLFEAALRQAYIDLDKPDPADEKSSYSWDTTCQY